MLAGLRVDIDTLRGTRLGVPRLLSLLDRYGIRATFFFSVGPDNMGRHLWRLLKPSFLWKMLRTRAPSLYGWGILRCGVVGRGPDIGAGCADVIRNVSGAGHEVGLHAWDHQRWQSMNMESADAVADEVDKGCRRLMEITGVSPTCSAAPAWRAPAAVLKVKQRFPFAYNSDCRGSDCFIPVDDSGAYQPQVPVTLPTYDEMVGSAGVTDANYNSKLLEFFRPDALNVLCIHAEVEGIAKNGLFEAFLAEARNRGIAFGRLDRVLAEQGELRAAEIRMRSLPGREGMMCFQGDWRDKGKL